MTSPAAQHPVPSPPMMADEIARAIEALPAEAIELLARRYFTPSAIRRRRIAERNAQIRELAAACPGGSGHELAEAVSTALLRYAASGWLRERNSVPPIEHRLLHRILVLTGGKVLGIDRVRQVLADVDQNGG